MSDAVKELASSGAIGMLGWLVKVLVASFVRQTEAVIKALDELVRASRAIRDNCQACRSDSLQTLRDAEGHIIQRIEQVVAAGHDKTFTETEKALGAAVEKIEASNKALIEAEEKRRLREEVEELSRPHNIGAVPHPVRG
jgi:hypothetical protein